MTPLQEVLVGIVKDQMKANDVNQAQLAARSGLSVATISALLSGRTEGGIPSWDKMLAHSLYPTSAHRPKKPGGAEPKAKAEPPPEPVQEALDGA